MASELLTVKEVADRLKLNPQTVRRWIRAGLLPASRVGRRQWRVKAEDFGGLREPRTRDLAKRRAAVAQIRALRDQIARRTGPIDVMELVRESRRELEERGAHRGS